MHENRVDDLLNYFLTLHPVEIDLSLERIRRLLNALGSPEKRLPPTIHVAGTNGKGSVTATMRAILQADGKRCHVYTSPHLVRFNERIRLGTDGRFVSDEALVKALEVCKEANAGEEITFFETTTAAAFHLFSQNPADVLLLEVGLGGILDATNVIEAPAASVIMPVSMDHEAFLGENLEGIAGEKAGIIKPGCPVVVAPQKDEVLAVIERQAARNKAPVYRFGQEFSASEDQGRLAYQDEDGLYDLPLSALPGHHQIANAGVAIAALKAARMLPEEQTIAKGLTAVSWPGRLQRLSDGPIVNLFPKGTEIWLDGGHNPNAGEAISLFLKDRQQKDPKPTHMICAMLRTKKPEEFFSPFKSLLQKIFTVPLANTPNGRTPEELAGIARSAGFSSSEETGFLQAVEKLAKQTKEQEIPVRILICGSLYLVGEVLAANDMMPE